MRRPAAIVAIALCFACENKRPPAPSPTPNGVENIRGTERLGWNQQGADAAEVATFRFAIYLDGVRSEVADVRCDAAAGANGFGCSGRLPSMPPGQHTLEVAAFVLDGSTIVESSRSSPLLVNVSASATNAGIGNGSLTADRLVTTREGVRLGIEVVREGLDDPVDLAFDARARLFVAERTGVRVIDGDRQEVTAIEEAGALLSLALDPAFDRTHLVYLLHTTVARDGSGAPVFRLARYREVEGRLGERAILLDGVPARREHPSAVVRFGPDAKLYVAFDDGGDALSAASAASLNGKLLRLNADGTTPDDQPAANPVYVAGYRSPRGLAFPAAGSVWMADGEPQEPERLTAAALASLRPRRAAVRSAYALDAGSHPEDAVVYRGELMPSFRGDLLVAAGGGHILRIRLDPRSPSRVVSSEKMLEGLVESIRALAVREDGVIYFATPSAIARLVLR